MDDKTRTLEHLKTTLAPFALHDADDVCERMFLDYGKAALTLHPASLLAHAHDLVQQPLGGEDGFGDLRWEILSPHGLPEVKVDLELHAEHKDWFLTNPPFTAAKVERDFYSRSDPDNDDAFILQYLTEDLDDEDRDNTFASIAEDCQEFAHCYIDSLKIKGWDGWGALIRDAAERGNIEAIGDALSLDISPMGADAHGNTALHLAAKNGHVDLIKPLVNAGADPNATNHDGKTPLHFAAQERWATCCLTLMANGASPMAKDNDGNIPRARERARGFEPSL